MAPPAAGEGGVGRAGGGGGERGLRDGPDDESERERRTGAQSPARGTRRQEHRAARTPRGGGSVWVPGTYDPETNLAFWGTGNGGPWMGDQRPGDNLYTAATVALDGNTGQIKGHFQYHQNDSWDWDEVSPPILVDYNFNNR